MPVIKRYPNRKLYDTEAKRYVTLEDIAALIRQRQEVRVVDHASGEDVTTVTLTQIILDYERRRQDFIPATVLAGLIQAGGETVASLRRSLALPLDLARHADEEIERRLQTLARRGELAAEEALRLTSQLLAAQPQTGDGDRPGDEEIEQALARLGLPTRRDIERLARQIDELAAKLDETR